MKAQVIQIIQRMCYEPLHYRFSRSKMKDYFDVLQLRINHQWNIIYQITLMLRVFKNHEVIEVQQRIYASLKQDIIGSDDVLSPARRQAIIDTSTELFQIPLSGTKYSEISIKIQSFSVKKLDLKMSSAKWWPFVGPRCVRVFEPEKKICVSLTRIISNSCNRLPHLWNQAIILTFGDLFSIRLSITV